MKVRHRDEDFSVTKQMDFYKTIGIVSGEFLTRKLDLVRKLERESSRAPESISQTEST